MPYEEQALRPVIQAAFEQGGVDAICRLVVGLLNEQEARHQAVIAKLEARITELEKRLGRNSSNSSKPPSSDGLRRTTSLRPKDTGRKPGGQPGHAGKTLQQVAMPDKVVELDLTECPHCATSLDEVAAESAERRQIFELPSKPVEVTEYRAARKVCPGCGRMHTAAFPAQAKAPTQYGPYFCSVMAHLRVTHLLPFGRIAELCGELWGHCPGVAAVINSVKRATGHMKPTVEAVAEALLELGVLYADETGARCEGRTRWMHVCCSRRLTHLSYGERRGVEGFAAAGILERFKGALVHDFWPAYLTLLCEHIFCNAHLLRELKSMKEQCKHEWGGHISAVLIEMKQAAAQALCTPQGKVPAARHKELHRRYDRLVAEGLRAHPVNVSRAGRKRGGRIKQSPEYNLLRRLDKYRKEILRFFDQPGAPFDNNQAERDLRMVKLQQKISGCFRTKSGAENFCTVRSYVSTAKKCGFKLLDSIFNAFLGSPFSLPFPGT